MCKCSFCHATVFKVLEVKEYLVSSSLVSRSHDEAAHAHNSVYSLWPNPTTLFLPLHLAFALLSPFYSSCHLLFISSPIIPLNHVFLSLIPNLMRPVRRPITPHGQCRRLTEVAGPWRARYSPFLSGLKGWCLRDVCSAQPRELRLEQVPAVLPWG